MSRDREDHRAAQGRGLATAATTATIVIASARYSVAAQEDAGMHVIRLNAIGRKRLRLSRCAALRATLTVTPGDRAIEAVRRTIKLKRAGR